MTFKNYYKISESLLDKGLMKAILMCGSPGAGKSYVLSKLTPLLDPQPKLFDSDKILEFKFKQRNLSPKWAKKDSKEFELQWKAREEALETTKKLLKNHLNGYLPIVIDGTGQSLERTKVRKQFFESLGYDVCMILVNTSLEVALERNRKRTRSLHDEDVKSIWKNVNLNIPEYKKEFNTFVEVNNDPGQLNISDFKPIIKFWNQPLQNPIGIDILKSKHSLPLMRQVTIPKELEEDWDTFLVS